MSGWRHVGEYPSRSVERRLTCPVPTPDPASPCGYRFDFWTMTDVCEMPGDHPMHLYSNARMYHDFVPTRCTCGHPLEATR